jgi:hypothetical protein
MKNKLDDKELKEMIGNSALGLLTQGNDYDSLSGLIVQFSYIFQTPEGIEAMFKITTDKKVLKFGVNRSKIMLIDLPDETFEEIAAMTIDRHSQTPPSGGSSFFSRIRSFFFKNDPKKS